MQKRQGRGDPTRRVGGQDAGQYFGLRREAQRHAALGLRGAFGGRSHSAVAARDGGAHAARPPGRTAGSGEAELLLLVLATRLFMSLAEEETSKNCSSQERSGKNQAQPTDE